MEILDRKSYIFKGLKTHLKYLQEKFPQYKVIYIALQGSQNYNLDIYTSEYKSDIDTKAIIVPSLEEMSKDLQPITETIILPNNEHCDVKDIREMFRCFKKQNINFLEILFTEYRIFPDKNFKDLLLELIGMNEDIARLDEERGLNAIAYMSQQKRVAMCHKYAGLIEKIEKYGYDPKQLHHIIRMNDFIKSFTSGMSYKECLTNYNDIDLLNKAKLGKFTLEEAIEIADKYNDETNEIKESFKEKCEPPNINILKRLDDIQCRIIKKAVELELNPVQPKINILDENLEKYPNVYLTSDLHFYHNNIIKYEPKRQTQLIGIPYDTTGLVSIIFDEHKMTLDEYCEKYIEIHNSRLIKNWNEVVNTNDLVIILGDFSFGSARQTEKVLEQLNGIKVLIRGNHDYFLDDKTFNKELFKQIIEFKQIKYKDYNITISHYPVLYYNKVGKDKNYHLFGHIHSSKLKIPEYSYNVGVDNNNYRPIHIDKAIEYAKLNKKYNKQINKEPKK